MWAYPYPESEEAQLREQYNVSKMGYMEDRIRYFGEYNTIPYLYFDEPRADVVIGQRGEPVTVKLVTSGEFEVS